MMIINGIKKFSMYCTYLRNYGSMLLLQQMYTLYNLYHKHLEVCRYIRQKCIIYIKSVHTPILSMVPTRNFEVHGTSKRRELRNTRNSEAQGTSKFVCILFYLNPYYSRTNSS